MAVPIARDRARRFSSRLILVAAALSLFLSGPTSAYENTFAKDFVMDAPWRVLDEHTPIPLTILLKDCDVSDIYELHRITCWENGPSGKRVVWRHDYGDERIGNNASEHNYWAWITTVAEGSSFLPDGTLLTPAALGYGPGAVIQLEVEIRYQDTIVPIEETENAKLRVMVGNGPFPWPAHWFGGDTHFHTMYTNNIAEFGSPIPAVREAALAMGLQWLITTDHSSDLDETGDGPISYATQQWEYTIQDAEGARVTVHDNVADGGTWASLKRDVQLHDGTAFRLYRGTELNVASIDADSRDKTLHCLFYNPEYVSSPRTGAPGERPVQLAVPDALAQLTDGGFAYASHPRYDLAMEIVGLDLGVNGARWGNEDLDGALAFDDFRGVEIFNERHTRHSTNESDPWSDFDAGQAPDRPYPQELLEGIDLWDQLLRSRVEMGRKVFLSAGSDAHGDFNYARYMAGNNYATDNAMGKVQTVVYVPGPYASGNLPPMDEILAAFRAGRSVVTDGPFLEIGIDRDDNGSWYDAGDLMIGDFAKVGPAHPLLLTVRWASLPEFGEIERVRLLAGDATDTREVWSTTLTQTEQRQQGEAVVDLAEFELEGKHYIRAELLTADGSAGHRAYTNPIWLDLRTSVPVLMESFDAYLRDGEVWVEWSMATPSDASALLLTARLGDDCRDLEIPPQFGRTFQVRDALADGRDGTIRYELFSLDMSAAQGQLLATTSLRVSAPSQVRLMGARPNPFRPPTTIHFAVPAPERVELTIHDIRGRQVRTLLDENLEPGEYAVPWDGRDDDGLPLARGVYLIRVTSPHAFDTCRHVLLR